MEFRVENIYHVSVPGLFSFFSYESTVFTARAILMPDSL